MDALFLFAVPVRIPGRFRNTAPLDIIPNFPAKKNTFIDNFLADRETLECFASKVIAEYGRVDHFVNNALPLFICIDGGMTRQMIYHNDFGWKLEETHHTLNGF